MEYRLYEGSLNDPCNAKKTVLLNRKISDVNGYLNINDNCLLNYKLLDNIDWAVACLIKHLEDKDNIHIVIDCDPDGFTSAAMLYSYIKLVEPSAKLTYSLHTGKAHGLSDDIIISDGINLVIVPDAGTNDIRQCYKLNEQGIDIIILDHHKRDSFEDLNISQEELEFMGEAYASAIEAQTIVVNNQTSNNYQNKDLCGAGIVYKFLQAVDSETWNDYANNFLDLVALGNIADNMDVRSFETKRLIDKGLRNIHNKLFVALIEKQSYSMGGKVDIIGVQWYVVPLINGMIRAGSQEDKEIMFRAFLEQDEFFEHKTRASKGKESEIIQESIYDRVARLCVNAKTKQNKSKEVGIDSLCEYIDAKGLDKNKILFVPVDSMLDKNLTGVTAIKLAERYGKPCVLLRQLENQENSEDIIFGGSGRNLDNSPIESLKDFLIETKCFDFVSGHDGAFGFAIKKSNIQKAINIINKKLKNVEFDNKTYVDLSLDFEQINIGTIVDIAELKSCYGHRFNPAKIVIKDICLLKSDCGIIGKSSDTIKFVSDEIEYIKFRCKQDESLMLWLNDSDWNNDKNDEIVIDVLGECDINEFANKKTPQITIRNYEIKNK